MSKKTPRYMFKNMVILIKYKHTQKMQTIAMFLDNGTIIIPQFTMVIPYFLNMIMPCLLEMHHMNTIVFLDIFQDKAMF